MKKPTLKDCIRWFAISAFLLLSIAIACFIVGNSFGAGFVGILAHAFAWASFLLYLLKRHNETDRETESSS